MVVRSREEIKARYRAKIERRRLRKETPNTTEYPSKALTNEELAIANARWRDPDRPPPWISEVTHEQLINDYWSVIESALHPCEKVEAFMRLDRGMPIEKSMAGPFSGHALGDR